MSRQLVPSQSTLDIVPVQGDLLPASRATRSVANLPTNEAILAQLPPVVTLLANSHLAIWSLILILGPMGLPLLWLSPKYSTASKIAWTLGMIFMTVVLPIALTIYCTQFLVSPVLDAMNDANVAGGAV